VANGRARDFVRLRVQLQRCVSEISAFGPRDVTHPANLSAAARWIEGELTKRGYSVAYQDYEVGGIRSRNLEVELRGRSRPQEIVIVGAHYDSVPESPGADDNGSGVAAVIALAGAFAGSAPERTLRFVTFVNEEPPHFLTDEMGSLVYARRSASRRENIRAMLSIESIGYYSEEEGTQSYPQPLGLFYPPRADFIAFVSNLGSRRLLNRALRSFRARATIPSEGGALPELVPGIGWSDQWSFWQHGWPAIMITDTALYRNPNYHTASDTPDTLDYDRFTRVVIGLEDVVRDLANK
jgi:Zn-dependent M28 family amino/carboxypeptidase